MNEESVSMDALAEMAGATQKSFDYYQSVTIGNRNPKNGEGFDGGFITSEQKEGVWQKIEYAKKFCGNILFARGVIRNSGQQLEWESEEFKIGSSDPFPVRFFKDGKRKQVSNVTLGVKRTVKKKDGTNQGVVAFDPESQIEPTKDYTYAFILYVKVLSIDGEELKEAETIKLEFKGAGRGNWFGYTSDLAKFDLKFFQVETVFETYKEEGGYHSLKFNYIADEKGQPKLVEDISDIAKKIMDLNDEAEGRLKELPRANSEMVKQIEAKAPEEEEEVEDEIRIEDLPF